jgi:hypothetical protein
MAKMIEVVLHGITCEFAGDDDDNLEVSGTFTVQSMTQQGVIKTSEVIFGFPNGPIRLRKGESAAINREVRVLMSTPSVDPPDFGAFFVKFGGRVVEKDPSPDTDDDLGEQSQTLSTNDITNTVPRMWRFYFGRNEQIVRADFSVVFVHPV